MDKEFWAARFSAVMRHQHPWDRLSIDDLDVDEEVRLEFPCPYCFEEFDISTLCAHLEGEHLNESKGVVCPVCATKVLKDVVGHITIQHAHLFKSQRRRRFRRNAITTGGSSSFLGKELREAQLQALLGSSSFRNTGISGGNPVDSLLSALVNSLPHMGPDDSAKKNFAVEEVPAKSKSLVAEHNVSRSSLSAEEHEERLHQAASRAKFVQQLVLSTLLGDG